MEKNEKETIIVLTDYLKVLIEFAKLIKDLRNQCSTYEYKNPIKPPPPTHVNTDEFILPNINFKERMRDEIRNSSTPFQW